jgi:diaminohydroxyphosphoribosylaminopyrimidine deaminase/5-amino-6-(5-phosphoribosylamino)uracil reductase
MIAHEKYMYRCLGLARLPAGFVAPNPMVGAVLVHNDRIIGEGYHRMYGQAHAEVNCIASVQPADRYLISQSTLYVSLEPCAHFGKTPPCADLIIEKKIPTVVIGCRDPFKQVNGRGIEKLQAAGVEVITGVLEKEARELNKRFIIFHTQHRPYIILKWAQTANGRMAADNTDRLLISNELTNKLVHKWRSEEAGILIGTNTALADDPSLTNRLWNGPNPVRMVIDMQLRLPSSLQLFNNEVKTIVFNGLKHEEQENLLYYQVTQDVNVVHQLVNALSQLTIQSVLVEGGAKLLQSFIDEGLWDEVRIITNKHLSIAGGIAAPLPPAGNLMQQDHVLSDSIDYFVNPQTALI